MPRLRSIKPRHDKKTDTLEVRMPHDTKRAFLKACREEGRTASAVVREAVDVYLVRAARRRSSTNERNIAMISQSPAARRGALAAGAAGLGLFAFAVSPSTAQVDLRAAFDAMDADGDGRVSFEEYASPTPPAGGRGLMVVRSVERHEEGGAITVGEEEFWIPAAPREDMAEPSLEDIEVEEQDGRGLRIVRRVEGAAGEEHIEAHASDGAAVDVTEFMARMRQDEFARFDADADGAVDFDEFEGRHTAMITGTFERLDASGDGRVTSDEFAAFLLPEPEGPLPQSVFDNLDADGDGTVSLEEFTAGPPRG